MDYHYPIVVLVIMDDIAEILEADGFVVYRPNTVTINAQKPNALHGVIIEARENGSLFATIFAGKEIVASAAHYRDDDGEQTANYVITTIERLAKTAEGGAQ